MNSKQDQIPNMLISFGTISIAVRCGAINSKLILDTPISVSLLSTVLFIFLTAFIMAIIIGAWSEIPNLLKFKRSPETVAFNNKIVLSASQKKDIDSCSMFISQLNSKEQAYLRSQLRDKDIYL